MKRSSEWLLIVVGGGVFIMITVLSCLFEKSSKDMTEVVAITATFLFFSYRLLVGWLFINLDVNIIAERSGCDNGEDHLVLTVNLKKGNIDSCWVEDIQFRVSEISDREGSLEPVPTKYIKPGGMKKNIFPDTETHNIEALWDKSEERYYVLSPDEQACFSGYTKVRHGKVIFVELIVIGTRPFYSTLMRKRKPIQWRASSVVLPTV